VDKGGRFNRRPFYANLGGRGKKKIKAVSFFLERATNGRGKGGGVRERTNGGRHSTGEKLRGQRSSVLGLWMKTARNRNSGGGGALRERQP